MSDHALDDAAAAALARIHREPLEHIGVLYEQQGSISRTAPVSSGAGDRVNGAFQIPRGSMRGLYHNHPPKRDTGRQSLSVGDDLSAKKISPGDRTMAQQLGVPSYISAGDRVFRYNPSTGKTEEVLAQYPMDTIPARLETLMAVPPMYK